MVTTEVHVCEQLAQGRSAKAKWPGMEPFCKTALKQQISKFDPHIISSYYMAFTRKKKPKPVMFR